MSKLEIAIRRKRVGRAIALRLVASLGLAVLVASCGVTTAPAGDLPARASSPSVKPTASTPAPSPETPSATTTRTSISSSGAAPCSESSQDPSHPALILTPTTPNHAGSARIGDLVQIRLPTMTKWSYQPVQSSGALAPTQPSGVLIRVLNACVWSFHAVAAGTQTVSFSGQPICSPGKPCPNYRIAMAFRVSVS